MSDKQEIREEEEDSIFETEPRKTKSKEEKSESKEEKEILDFDVWKIPKKTPDKVEGRIFHWFWIAKTPLNHKLIQECKSDCTVKIYKRDFWTKERVPPILEYLEDDHHLLVPVNYGLKKFEKLKIDSIRDDRFLGYHRDNKELPVVKIELKEDHSQITGKDMCIKDLSKFGQASLCLPTGDGKTNVAIYIYGELCRKENKRLRCLVVCHVLELEAQFADRVQSTCPGIRVGLLRNKPVQKNPEKYDFIVCTVQSLTKKAKTGSKASKSKKNKNDAISMEDEKPKEDETDKEEKPRDPWEEYSTGFKYGDSFMCLFGLVVIDEAHRYSSNVWSAIFPMNNCRYLLQLTATPKPGGGTEKRRDLWCGKPSFWKIRSYAGIGRVKYYEPEYERITDQYMNERNYDNTKMTNDLCSVDDRNQYMVKMMLEEGQPLFAQGLCLLAVTERIKKIEHCGVIKNMIRERDPNITVCIVGGDEEPMTKEEIVKHNIILSTFSKMSLFFDADNIAMIAILTPDVSNTIMYQLFGRGTRMNSISKVLNVLYFIERYSFFESRFQQHHKYFEELKFDIILADVKTKRGLEYLEYQDGEEREKVKRKSKSIEESHFGADARSFKPKGNPF